MVSGGCVNKGGENVDARQQKLFDEIVSRWSQWRRDANESGLSQAIFDIGVLAGIIASLDNERKDLLARLHEAVAPD